MTIIGLEESKMQWEEWLMALQSDIPFAAGAARELIIDHQQMGDEDLARLLTAPGFAQLESIYLHYCNLTDAGIQMLGAATLPALHTLTLGYGEFTNEAIAGLTSGSAFPNLRKLSLGIDIDTESAQRLAAWPGLANIQTLELWSNQIEPKALECILTAPHASQLTGLHLSEIYPDEGLLQRLVDMGIFLRLTAFSNISNEVHDDELKAFLEATYDGPLVSLSLESSSLGDQEAILIAQEAHWPQLQSLDLSYNNIGEDGACALAQLPWLQQLTAFAFVQNDPGIYGLQALCASPFLHGTHKAPLQERLDEEEAHISQGLVELRQLLDAPPSTEIWKQLQSKASQVKRADSTWLREVWIPYAQKHLSTWPVEQKREYIQHFINYQPAQEPHWPLVESVDTSRYWYGDEDSRSERIDALCRFFQSQEMHQIKELIWTGWDPGFALKEPILRAITHSPYLAQLEMLDISQIRPGPEGAALLAGSPTLRSLRYLNIGGGFIKGEGLAALMASPVTHSLNNIQLWNNDLYDEDIEYIAKSTALSGISSMDLGINRLHAEGIKRLVDSRKLGALQELFLQENSILSEGAYHLAQCQELTSLRWLELFRNHIGDEGLRHLLASPYLTQLQRLGLGLCGLGHPGWEALAHSPNVQSLQALDIDDSDFIADDAIVLANSPYLGQLRSLCIEACEIGGKGFYALLNSPTFQLQTLHLNFARLTAEDIQVLAQHPGPRMQILELNHNDFGDEGLAILAEISSWPSLKTLVLRANHITDDGACALAKAPWLQQLTTLNLQENPIGDEGKAALEAAISPQQTLLMGAPY